MEDIKAVERKVTSITLPLDWWETFKEAVYLRDVQGDAASLNAVMLEAMGAGIEDIRLDVAARRGRRA